MGTHMEQKKKIAKIPLSIPLKKKNWTPRESMPNLSLVAWNFYFWNCLPLFLNGMATSLIKKRKERSPPLAIKKKLRPFINVCWAFHFSPLLFTSRWGASQVQFFLQRANLIGPSLNKTKTMEAPQNIRFYFEV